MKRYLTIFLVLLVPTLAWATIAKWNGISITTSSTINGMHPAKINGQTVAAGGGGDFVTDTFTDVNGTDLTNHDPETGSAWAKEVTSSNYIKIYNPGATSRIYGGSIGYINTASPPSANYYVQATFYWIDTATSAPGLILRASNGSENHYLVRHNQTSGYWQVYKDVGGSYTHLGTDYADTPSAGNTRTVKATISTSDGTVTIVVNIDGTDRIPDATDSDSPITGAGYAGVIWGDTATTTTGQHIDNFSAR